MTGVLRAQGVGLLVLAVTCVAGCDGEKGGTWPTDPGPTVVTGVPTASSPSPSVTAVDPPELPEAATRPTRAGAQAFFRYFWDVYNYSYSALDHRQLRSISSTRCSSCGEVVRRIDSARREGHRFEGGGVTVRVIIVSPGEAKRGLVIHAVIDQAASRMFNGADVVSTSPPRSGRTLDAAIAWEDGRWYMLALDTEGKADS